MPKGMGYPGGLPKPISKATKSRHSYPMGPEPKSAKRKSKSSAYTGRYAGAKRHSGGTKRGRY